MKPAEGSTLIGRSVTIRGEISGAEDLYLDGAVEGTITLEGNRLTVGPNARIVADLEVRDITVQGHIEGNIRASGRVELRETATVHGDIFTSRLSIEEKAMIQGKVDVGDSAPAAVVAKQSSGEAVPAKAPLFTGAPAGAEKS